MNEKILPKANKKIGKKREFRKKCKECGKMSKVYRMFDVDGINLVEHLVCLECNSGTPALL